MKKTLIPFACLLLFAGSVAYASTPSLVGKKVAKEVVVNLDGVKLNSGGIIVDGKTYAPVRDVAESFGAKVEFKGGEVVLSKVPSVSIEDSTITTVEGKQQIIERNASYIQSLNNHIEEIIKRYPPYENSEEHKGVLAQIDTLTKENERLQKEIDASK